MDNNISVLSLRSRCIRNKEGAVTLRTVFIVVRDYFLKLLPSPAYNRHCAFGTEAVALMMACALFCAKLIPGSHACLLLMIKTSKEGSLQRQRQKSRLEHSFLSALTDYADQLLIHTCCPTVSIDVCQPKFAMCFSTITIQQHVVQMRIKSAIGFTQSFMYTLVVPTQPVLLFVRRLCIWPPKQYQYARKAKTTSVNWRHLQHKRTMCLSPKGSRVCLVSKRFNH